jgi:hypothetical protein
MRVAVLPRDVAARVITGATARGIWAANAANLALTLGLLIEFGAVRGILSELSVPMMIVSILLACAIAAGFTARPVVVIAFLLVCTTGAIVYQLTLLAAYPPILTEGYFLLNRPAVSLVLVAVGVTTWLIGLAWILVGYLMATIVSVAVALATGLQFATGAGPTLVLLTYVLVHLALAGIQASQRHRVPNLDALEEATRQRGFAEDLKARATAVAHDTLLNDLAIVMNAPTELDARARDRLRADVATLRSDEWLGHASDTAVVVDDQDIEMRNQIMKLMSELQWRGLTVHVTGSGSGIYRLAQDVATAIVDSIGACLENVLKHSGTTVAEVDLAYADNEITVIVSDQGVGFDVDSVASDRLGLSLSVVERIRAIGGTAKVWSSVGAGTSIVMRIPVVEKVSAHEESTHGAA